MDRDKPEEPTETIDRDKPEEPMDREKEEE
jgi:hypothetical protein